LSLEIGMASFTPQLDILPQAQRRLWPELEQVPRQFTLYGGTAIALQLGRRNSVDFDFFSSRPFNSEDLIKNVPFLSRCHVLRSLDDTLDVRVKRGRPIGVSFFAISKLSELTLPMALSAGKALYGSGFEPKVTLRALEFYGDGTLSKVPATVRERLISYARAVDLDKLPDIGKEHRGDDLSL
jgi:Nucleotidyl transferase AbiEii toxin, Type IV TA system